MLPPAPRRVQREPTAGLKLPVHQSVTSHFHAASFVCNVYHDQREPSERRRYRVVRGTSKGLVLLFPSPLQISTVPIRCVLRQLQVARARRAIKARQINTWETEQMLIWAVAGRSSFSGGFTANDPHYLLTDCGGECESHTKAISVPLRSSRQSLKKKKKKIEIMNDRLTVEWLRSANCRSRCQTLQTYMRTVVVHIAGNGLKCINMCITKRALHYLWEWIRARRGDVIAHATRSLGLRSVASADERWPQLMWILCTINICSPASLQKERG